MTDFMSAMAQEWRCPLTQELPVDPVCAEDGRVYERTAIETALLYQRKSPMTNEPMGCRLVPVVQIRNSIRSMIDSKLLPEATIDAWKQRTFENTQVMDLRRLARSKDERGAAAAHTLGVWHLHGGMGLPRDDATAYVWFKRGADLGNITSVATCGALCALGRGVQRNDSRAVFYYMQAAMAGSAAACWNLGMCFTTGLCGLDKDEDEALKWFELVPACKVQDR